MSHPQVTFLAAELNTWGVTAIASQIGYIEWPKVSFEKNIVWYIENIHNFKH